MPFAVYFGIYELAERTLAQSLCPHSSFSLHRRRDFFVPRLGAETEENVLVIVVPSNK